MCWWFPMAISLPTLTHTTHACTSGWSIGVHWHSLLGLSERNDYHTSVSTCHWDLLESAISLARAQALTFTDSAIRYCMLMQIVGGCLTVCVSTQRARQFKWVRSERVSILPAQSQLQLLSFCVVLKCSTALTLFSPLQRVVTPTRGRCCPSSALPRGSVFSEWRAWLSTAATSEWCQPAPH